jgi:hypothetical protein
MSGGNGKIRGGYCLHARKTDLSEIAHASPCTREVFFLCVRRASFKDHQQDGRTIRRGQWFTSYGEIQEALHWQVGHRRMVYTRAQIEATLKWLRTRSMITTTKTTDGLRITVCNYSVYQNPRRYEHHTEDHDEDHDDATPNATPYIGSKKRQKNDRNNGKTRTRARSFADQESQYGTTVEA